MSDLIEEVIGCLNRVKKWDWRTTRGLEEELRLPPNTLYPVLEVHANQGVGKRKIRYHKYPSPRIEVLWGLVERVKEDPELESLRRVDTPQVGSMPYEDRRLVFISHSSRDEAAAKEVGEMLNSVGVRPWLFEMDIVKDRPIITGVYESIHACDGAIVFISRGALGSLWVHKEFLEIQRQFLDQEKDQTLPATENNDQTLPLSEINDFILVVLDGNDNGLLEAFEKKDPAKVEQCMRACAMSEKQIRLARRFAGELFYIETWLIHPDTDGIHRWVETLNV